jgi:lipoate-protein ligase B
MDPDGETPRKIGALGIRIERGTSYHGVALNVDVALADFDLIDACGMPGLVSTSIARELGHTDERPSTARVAEAAGTFAPAFARLLGATLRGTPAPDADPVAERRALDALLAPVAA